MPALLSDGHSGGGGASRGLDDVGGINHGAQAVGAGDGECAVADGEADAFGGTGTDISGGEDTGDGGFEGAGVAVGQGPAAGAFGVVSGGEIAEVVFGHGVGKSAGVGISADEDEDGGRGEGGVRRAVAM